jgi:hypothetical protein
MNLRKMCDHGADRSRFAQIAPTTARTEPAETGLGIIRLLLLRVADKKAELGSQCAPARAEFILRGRLTAAMQNDNQRRMSANLRRHKDMHPQIAGVRPEISNLDQWPRDGRRISRHQIEKPQPLQACALQLLNCAAETMHSRVFRLCCIAAKAYLSRDQPKTLIGTPASGRSPWSGQSVRMSAQKTLYLDSAT